MPESCFAHIVWRAQPARIEYQWLCAHNSDAPLLVFLHEGLGSVALWHNFPQQLCEALGVRGLVYSRPGYGASSPHPDGLDWQHDFMHEQANDVLPTLLAALGVQQPPWLFGHSDGASIALLYAAQHASAGLIVLAPHVFVEALTVHSIEEAAQAYENTDLRQRLSPYHADVDAAFWGWSRVWLQPSFRHWSIQAALADITCPVLAIQGQQDNYGSMAHLRAIEAAINAANADTVQPRTRVPIALHAMDNCGHSPHRDQPQALLQICSAFFQTHMRTLAH